MNLTYIIGLVAALFVFVLGIVLGINLGPNATPGAPLFDFNIGNLGNFFDAASIFIVIGCTIFILVASFPPSALKDIPKHFKVAMNTKKNDPMSVIDQLVELAQAARKDGLLALEGLAAEQKDPFFKQAIMLIVDANDPDRVRSILENDIECMSARHEASAALYEKGSAVAPAFGMIGTLVGLINMLKNMNFDDGGGAGNIGSDMSVALVTTLYGCILAHMIFGPIANNLRSRDEEEVLCKMIIVEGITCIQAGENPKLLREKLNTFIAQRKRDAEGGKKGKGGGGEE